MSRTRVHYRGRVQGVGFRVTARSIAHGHPVTGWVRNEPDGSVLLEAQGSPEEVAAMLGALRERMGQRIVSEASSDVQEVEDESSFVIRS
jgi:acylphosphatase